MACLFVIAVNMGCFVDHGSVILSTVLYSIIVESQPYSNFVTYSELVVKLLSISQLRLVQVYKKLIVHVHVVNLNLVIVTFLHENPAQCPLNC